MPPAPCTTGSTMTRGQLLAWRSKIAQLRRAGLVQRRVEAGGRARRRTPAAGRTLGPQLVHAAVRVAERHRRRGVAVVAAAQGQHAAAARLARCRQYCRHIFIATSTATEPESARNTRSSRLRRHLDQPFGEPDRRLVGQAAEHHVAHPSSCCRAPRRRAPGGGSRGSRTTRRPCRRSARVPSASRRRVPSASDDRQDLAPRQRRVGVPDVIAIELEELLPICPAHEAHSIASSP